MPAHKQNPMLVHYGKAKEGGTCERCAYLRLGRNKDLYICTMGNEYLQTKNFDACSYLKLKEETN